MAITPTITASLLQPYVGIESHSTKQRVEHLQTAGSAATMGAVAIFGSATASNEFFLENVSLSFINPTASVQAILYLDTTAVATFPTMAAAVTVHNSLHFGAGGINGGTTTTVTVSVMTSIGTTTVQFFASGYRKL